MGKKFAGYIVIFVIIIIPAFCILAGIYSFLPLILFVGIWICHYLLFKYNSQEKKKPYPKRKAIGLLFITIISCVVAWFFYDANFFAMGPFYPQAFVGNQQMLKPKDSIEYRRGYLVTYKNTETKEPSVLTYKSENKIVWSQQLNAPDIFWHEGEEGEPEQMAYEIGLTRISKGLVRDKLEFFASGHSEPGWLYIWRFGGPQKFFIMNF